MCKKVLKHRVQIPNLTIFIHINFYSDLHLNSSSTLFDDLKFVTIKDKIL